MKITLCRTFRFDAAHRNMSAGASARTARMHGHTYEAAVRVSGPLNEDMGWLLDFGEIKAAAGPVIDRLDHRCLNEVAGLTETTRDDVARWATARLQDSLGTAVRCDVRLLGATDFRPVFANDGAPDGGKRIVFGFAAAHYLPRLSAAHKCRRVHGHSFEVEVAAGNRDAVIDRVRDHYPLLDHTLLNEIDGLENPTSENLARWLWTRVADDTALEEIVVRETCATSCHYSGA